MIGSQLESGLRNGSVPPGASASGIPPPAGKSFWLRKHLWLPALNVDGALASVLSVQCALPLFINSPSPRFTRVWDVCHGCIQCEWFSLSAEGSPAPAGPQVHGEHRPQPRTTICPAIFLTLSPTSYGIKERLSLHIKTPEYDQSQPQ